MQRANTPHWIVVEGLYDCGGEIGLLDQWVCSGAEFGYFEGPAPLICFIPGSSGYERYVVRLRTFGLGLDYGTFVLLDSIIEGTSGDGIRDVRRRVWTRWLEGFGV